MVPSFGLLPQTKCLAGNAAKDELPFIIESVRLFYARHGTAGRTYLAVQGEIGGVEAIKNVLAEITAIEYPLEIRDRVPEVQLAIVTEI